LPRTGPSSAACLPAWMEHQYRWKVPQRRLPVPTSKPLQELTSPQHLTLLSRRLPASLCSLLQACPEGTYTEQTGGTTLARCVAAPKGTFADGTGNDGYTPCEGGTYQNEAGQSSCKVGGEADCLPMPVCLPATLCPILMLLTPSCSAPWLPCLQPCPPGHQCPAGSQAPTQCRAGFFADLKSPWCRECPRGTFQNAAGQRACKPCPAGSYCPNSKMATAILCPAGRFGVRLSAIQAADCVKCTVNVSRAVPVLLSRSAGIDSLPNHHLFPALLRGAARQRPASLQEC
jgi:hypothetical protein